jgi:hypothetical protein
MHTDWHSSARGLKAWKVPLEQFVHVADVARTTSRDINHIFAFQVSLSQWRCTGERPVQAKESAQAARRNRGTGGSSAFLANMSTDFLEKVALVLANYSGVSHAEVESHGGSARYAWKRWECRGRAHHWVYFKRLLSSDEEEVCADYQSCFLVRPDDEVVLKLSDGEFSVRTRCDLAIMQQLHAFRPL